MSLLQTRILSNSLFKQLVTFPVCTHCLQSVKNIQKRILIRTITDEHVTRIDETFTGRLLIYLNTDKRPTIESNNCTEILNILKNNDAKKLKELDTEQILSSLTSITNNSYIRNKYEFSEILNVLDVELCKRLSNLNTRDKLNILHAYMRIIPNKIIQYNYYKKAVEELYNNLELLNRSDIIQLIFYIGLQKKTGNSQSLLKKCIQVITSRFLNDLATEELCVICNSSFKTSTKIREKLFLNKVIEHLNNNLCLCNDPPVLVTLIKTVRQNRYASEDLLNTLSCTIFFNKTLRYYSFTALCHILALYSDFFYYDENLTKAFTEKCIEQLRDGSYTSKNTYHIEQPRVKDIKRLLWCLYNLNYKHLKVDDISNIIIPNIMKRIKPGDVTDNSASLIDIILYLWMLNYRAEELMPYVLTKKNIQLVKASKSPVKYRLNLLLSCIYFEDKQLYRKLNVLPPDNPKYDTTLELNRRPVLRKIFKCLQRTIAIQNDINKYELGFQVPDLKVAGITGYRKSIYKAIHIEVLDEYTTLKNTDHLPTGLMQLKLRLLEKQEEGLIVIQAYEVEPLTDEELHSFLLDEINFVC